MNKKLAITLTAIGGALALAAVIFVILGSIGFKSIVPGGSCSSAPLLINGQQPTSITELNTLANHQFTPAELDNLGITSCTGGLCTTTCAAVSP